MLTVLLTVALAADHPFEKIGDFDGISLEQRRVDGSAFVELRLKTVTTKSVAALCDAAFGDGKFDPKEPELKARTVLAEKENERVLYDQLSPPLVAKRDYVVRARKEVVSETTCRMSFGPAPDFEQPVPEGWVRITKFGGLWTFERQADGKTALTYVVHSDPAGSIPPFLAEGSRRTIALKWVRMIIDRAKAGP